MTDVRRIVEAAFIVEDEDGERTLVELPLLDPTGSGAVFTARVVEHDEDPDRLDGYDVSASLTTPRNPARGESVLRMRLVGRGTRLICTEDV